jgi:hypothetical protein
MTDETTQAATPETTATTTTEPADPTFNLEAVATPEVAEETPATTTDEAPESSTEETSEEAKGEEPDGKKKLSGSQRLKRRLQAIEAEFLNAQSELEEYRRKETEAPKADAKPGIDREPTEADFPNDYFAFERAKVAWDVRQAIREENAKVHNTTQRKEQDRAQVALRQERLEAYEELVETVRERIPDFDKVLQAASDVKINNPELVEEIMASDKSALLQYYLAKNLDKARELNGMRGRGLAREIGRLEAKVHLPTPKKATTASPPPSQPKGGAAPPADLASADMETYVALRRKQGFVAN